MIKLAKLLVKYKQWLDALRSGSLLDTIEVDIAAHVRKEQFRKVLADAANANKKITKQQRDSLLKLFDTAVEWANVSNFATATRRQFSVAICKSTKIKRAAVSRLFGQMKKALQLLAQRAQFGEFLSTVDGRELDRMFHHIKKVHINEGSESSIKSVFQLFSCLLHHGDDDTAISKCRSTKRSDERTKNRQSGRRNAEHKH